ncbi:MAG: glyoxylate/hydroxypyruvate reductase A [Rhodospirillales bacterium]|nr:glyoxylate/hydroxypyruvate reductase A [Rhodospirillales bacterium]
MALLFKSDVDRADAWSEALNKYSPELEVRVWPEEGAAEEIDYALVWKPPRGLLAGFPNLKAIFSLGAGIDHLASDPELPAGVPVVRMVEPGLTAGMTEYVAMSVLLHHRRMLDYAAAQRDKMWAVLETPLAGSRRVGIMGLGVLGTDAAETLAGLGFDVAGWSRSPKQVPGVESFHGAEGLQPFLARSEILVCLLPLTPETRGILDSKTMAMLPEGAVLINAARGEMLVEDDLLRALGSGQIAGASLDVFNYEPPVPDHPFWEHPRIVMTPHCASITVPDTGARMVAENIRRLESGQSLEHVVDLAKGY